MPGVYRSADLGDKGENGKTRVIIFTGKGTPFDPDRKVRTRDLRGYPLSQTILCAEAGPDKAEFWTRPNETPVDPKDPAATLGQVPRRGFNVASVAGWQRQVRTSSPSLFKMILPFAEPPVGPGTTRSGMKGAGVNAYSPGPAIAVPKSSSAPAEPDPFK